MARRAESLTFGSTVAASVTRQSVFIKISVVRSFPILLLYRTFTETIVTHILISICYNDRRLIFIMPLAVAFHFAANGI